METLTPQEERAMQYIWKTGMCCVKDILLCYPDPKPRYTSLASIMNSLKQKGYLDARRFGSTYIYIPLFTEEEYAGKSVDRLVEDYFADSYKNMVFFCAREQKISKKDLDDIIRCIEEQKGE